jgi:hypothetical protein
VSALMVAGCGDSTGTGGTTPAASSEASASGAAASTSPSAGGRTASDPYNGSTAHSSFDSTRAAAKGGVPGFQDVTGIGDRGFLTATGLIEFAKGLIVVIIQVLSSASPTTNTMTTLGQAAAGRV